MLVYQFSALYPWLMSAKGQTCPGERAISKSDAASGRGKEVAVQERRERLAVRALVEKGLALYPHVRPLEAVFHFPPF